MALDRRKRGVLYLCLFTYTVSYLCRTNLSIAIEPMMADLSLSSFQMSFVNTLYFWFYGTGQIFGGLIASKHDPKRILIAGFLLTGTLNIAVSFCHALWAIALLWAMNGLALALFWPAVMQICSRSFTDDEFASVSMLLNLPTTLGYFLSWASFSPLAARGIWKMIFVIPGLIAYASVFVWIFAGSAAEPGGRRLRDTGGIGPVEHVKVSRILLQRSMIAFACILVLEGAARESMNTWAPILVKDNLTVSAAVSSFLLSTIPLVNTVGIFVTRHFIKNIKGEDDSKAACVIVIMTAVLAVLLWLFRSSNVLFILFYAVELSALCAGASFVTTLVPLRIARTGHSALVSGIFNFTCYVGASLGMLISGAVSTAWGWNAIYVLWVALSLIAVLFLPFIFRRKGEKAAA